MNDEIEILLVEDNPNDAEMTIRALRKNNLANQLLHVKDGAEALDIKMPKVDGIEVLRTIRSDDRTKTIPVVILTSSREDPDIKKCYALGVNSYVVKPVEFDEFYKAVSSLGLYWMIVNQAPR